MIPDVDSLASFDPDQLKAEWTADVSRITSHFGFDPEQQKKAQAILDENLQWATYWFDDPENAEKLKKYEHDVREMDRPSCNPESLSYQKERANDGRRGLEADRRSLIAPLVDRRKELRDAVVKARDRRPVEIGRRRRARRLTSLDVINRLTMFGLVAIGFCLIAGLFTPLAPFRRRRSWR